jgi:broad specificity phosphatase PhoE
MRLYWVRHGQMEIRAHQTPDLERVDRLFNQKEEGGLTALGHAQAEAVARRLLREPLDAVYASPLVRARETAETTAAAAKLPVTLHEGIRELRPGSLPRERPTVRALDAVIQSRRIPFEWKQRVVGASLIPLYLHAWWRGNTVGGEAPDELRARLRAVLRELAHAHPEHARLALFSHGYLILLLSLQLAGGRLGRMKIWRRPYIPNGAITEVELSPSGQARLVRFAGADHLG